MRARHKRAHWARAKGLEHAHRLAAGDLHAVATLSREGGYGAVSWGAGCPLGHGDTGAALADPAPIARLKGVELMQVAAGDFHSAAITAKGTLLVWGASAFGQLGTGLFVQSKYPLAVVPEHADKERVVEVSCGGNVTGVLTSNQFGGTDEGERKAYYKDLKTLESDDLEMGSIGLTMASLATDLDHQVAEAGGGAGAGDGGGEGGGDTAAHLSAKEKLERIDRSQSFGRADASAAGTAAVEQGKGNWMYMAQKRRASVVTPRGGGKAYMIPPPPLLGDKNAPGPPPPPPPRK